MFSKNVRKFNRELLKATCLVIGCKRMYANKIAEKVFDDFNHILNNLSDAVGFSNHFEIGREQISTLQTEDQASTPLKHFSTITISGTLFKFILKRYLVEKFNYSRPEYLKDFYVASDLVRKSYLLIK